VEEKYEKRGKNHFVMVQNRFPASLQYTTLVIYCNKGREAGVYSALQLEEADCTLTP
jgi:hypothetical protein